MNVSTALVVLLAVVAASCGPSTGSDLPEPDRPAVTVDAAAWRPAWDDAVPAAGPRSIDLDTAPADVSLVATQATDTSLGILAVDRLAAPTLDGRLLVDELPPEAAFVVRPDGVGVLTLWDLFDPRYRGRVPDWEILDAEEGSLEIDRLADDPDPAKVVSWATGDEMLFLRDDEGRVSFYALGSLRGCLRIGRPVTAVSLRDPEGSVPTVLDVPAGTEISLSAVDGDPVTVWRADGDGRALPEVSLPAELAGVETLCIAVTGPDGAPIAFEEMHLTVEVDAADLVPLTRFDAGERSLRFDAAGSAPRAMLMWDAPDLTVTREPVVVPDEATIRRDPTGLEIAFPSGVVMRVAFADGEPTGIAELAVDGVPVLVAPPGGALGLPKLLRTAGERPPGDGFDWITYRDAFFAAGRRWEPRGSMTVSTISELVFTDATLDGSTVTLTWEIAGGGTLQWIVTPTTRTLAGEQFAGLAMRWAVDDAPDVTAVVAEFPLLGDLADRELHQYFRVLHEVGSVIDAPTRRPAVAWFGESQSFLFRTSPGRTVVAAFDEPTWATVSSTVADGRDVQWFEIPVDAEGSTAALEWFGAPRGVADPWQAVDLWAEIHEDLRQGYLAATGVPDSMPLPTVVWNQPTEEEQLAALQRVAASDRSTTGGGWFDRFADTELDRIAAAGLRNVIIQAPWMSDADDPDMASSFHAPRQLVVSDLRGGEEGLGRLVEAAHARGIAVTLWYPSAYSIVSPLFEDHPDWIVWKADGTPDDGGWGDLVVVDKGPPYRRYVVDRLGALRRRIPFDGVWMDSWVDIAVPTDHADERPRPQLAETVALQRAFGKMGLTQIVIEGLGPLGRPDAYGDYETYSGPPEPDAVQRAELERIRGHEYLLYRMGAGVALDVDVYVRALASGGLVNVANMDEVEALTEVDRDRFVRINEAYDVVRDRMRRRSVLVVDDRWVGVAWTDPATAGVVVFAFEDLDQRLDGPTSVRDVVDGTVVDADDAALLRAWHVYVLEPRDD